jgi:DNA-binding transcriptional MerR regulator
VAWSTRQLAELAGTTLRAVRHYHEVGLLPEPERRSNGYKQYGVAHLVRLLRITRLTGLGFSLPQIAEMGDADEHPGEALRALDAELAATIERLTRARAELGVILRQAAPTDLPPEIAPATAHAALTAADRSLVVVLTRVLGPSGLDAYREMLQDTDPDPTVGGFDDLPEDADEQTRADLADRMVPFVRGLHARYPRLRDIGADAPGGADFAMRTMGVALRELYNTAQLDVLRRVHDRLQAPPPR